MRMRSTDPTPSAQPLVRQKASDFHPEVLRLFDSYVHGLIGRRGFLEAAAKYAVAGITANALLEALSPNFAQAEQVPDSDPRIKSERVEIDSPQGNGKIKGYLVRPAKNGGKLPAVLVVHENRGLNPHIEDIARRVALEKFLAFAPDALTSVGGYPGDEDKARELFSSLDQNKTQEDFVAAAHYLKSHPLSTGRLGVVGFCWGGGIAHMLATRMPDLDAAVPFYGKAPSPDAAAQVKAALLVHLADQDERVNSAWPPYEEALKSAGVKYEVFRYQGTQHGFNNDTTPRYDEAAAKLAWQRTIAFFNKNLHGKGHAAHGGLKHKA
jgi:carboxymethylenebutenolidase